MYLHQSFRQTDSPQANGAERRSGRNPGERVTNSALAFTFITYLCLYQVDNRSKQVDNKLQKAAR